VPPSVSLLRVSGIFAWIAAASLWYAAARIVLAIGTSPADHAATPAPGEPHPPLPSHVSSS